MKKLHSLFVLSILALTMFVGCQNPTDGTGNGVEAVETESKVNEYGFTSSETYTVVFTNGSSTTMTGEALTNAAKDTGMINGTDYTINGKTVTLTASGVEKMTSYLENGGNSNGGDDTPTTYTLVGDEPDSAAKYVLANLPTTKNPSEYAEGDTVTFSIKTKTGETPTGLYLVKVTIKKRWTGDVLDIPVTYNKENHTVSFTIPDKDVMVRADFEDVSFEKTDDSNSNVTIAVYDDDKGKPVVRNFDVGLCFDKKDFDNLNLIGNKHVFRVANNVDIIQDGDDGYYECKITSTAKNYKSCAIVGEEIFTPEARQQINIKSVN